MKKGFTLIELLIVIGILAILATTVVLVLNPAQILQEARDTQRIADLQSVVAAIALAGSQSVLPEGFVAGATTPRCIPSGCSPFLTGTCLGGATVCSSNVIRLTGGTGWVAFNFGAAPTTIPTLPIDPSNTACTYSAGPPVVIGGNCYAARASAAGPSATFELDARLESTKHAPLMANDGGNNDNFYEVGTALNL